MLIVTTKLTKKKLVAAVVVCGLLICALVMLVSNRPQTVHKSTDDVVPSAKGLKTNDDRLAYLASLGWETGTQPAESQEVRIPDTFDDVMASYNKIQTEQGFDLNKYKGKRVMRYSYEVFNHKSGQTGVFAEMLIYKNELIGGDIHTNKLDGFMQGLMSKEACACPSGAHTCPDGCMCRDCKRTPNPAESETALLEELGIATPEAFSDSGAGSENEEYEDVSLPETVETSEPSVVEPR